MAFLPSIDAPKSFHTENIMQDSLSYNQQQVHIPAAEYGPPSKPQSIPNSPDLPDQKIKNETTTGNSEDEVVEISDPTVIAVSNAVGNYYILGKDHNLQRVDYQTTQTAEDKRNNGFTAHLRYSTVPLVEPIEPIRGPIYRYDTHGNLVRLY